MTKLEQLKLAATKAEAEVGIAEAVRTEADNAVAKAEVAQYEANITIQKAYNERIKASSAYLKELDKSK
tara:strand:- start:4973 stop:5179 length:207 start_codon:yes stop_codon:yes gene_type:complete